MRDIICLLVGPSGSGKTTIANKLAQEKGWKIVESYTTRPKRYPEETGHIFVTEEDFEQCSEDDICAYTKFDGHKYWATIQQVDESDLYIIDPAGINFFMRYYRGHRIPVVIGLCVDEPTCKKRMQERGDSKAAIKRRLKHDKRVFKDTYADIYVSENADLESAIAQICDIRDLYAY